MATRQFTNRKEGIRHIQYRSVGASEGSPERVVDGWRNHVREGKEKRRGKKGETSVSTIAGVKKRGPGRTTSVSSTVYIRETITVGHGPVSLCCPLHESRTMNSILHGTAHDQHLCFKERTPNIDFLNVWAPLTPRRTLACHSLQCLCQKRLQADQKGLRARTEGKFHRTKKTKTPPPSRSEGHQFGSTPARHNPAQWVGHVNLPDGGQKLCGGCYAACCGPAAETTEANSITFFSGCRGRERILIFFPKSIPGRTRLRVLLEVSESTREG